MGYSNTELANQALDHLGKENIATLTEASTSARKVNAVFERSIHSALARSRWSFSRKIAALAEVTNDWDERWTYKYTIPSDNATIIRLIPRADMPGTEPQIPFEILNGHIYTNEYQAKAEYVFKTTATLDLPEPFLDAVSFLIARNVAMPLTRKMSVREDMDRAYERQLAIAVMHDAGQQPNDWQQRAGGYIDARGGAESEIEGAAPDGSIYWK